MKKADLKRLLCLSISATVVFSAGFMAFADETDEEDAVPVEIGEEVEEDISAPEDEEIIEDVDVCEEDVIVEEDIDEVEEAEIVEADEVSPSLNYTGWEGPDSYGRYKYFRNGEMVKKEFLTIGGKTYYFLSNGDMAVGRTSVYDSQSGDTNVYMFGLSGAMQTGWVKFNRYWYYFDPSNGGAAVCDSWYTDSKGNSYYFDETGACYADKIVEIGKDFFCFDSNGKMVKDSFFTKESYYGTITCYADSNGHCVRGWKTINGKKYYFNTDDYEEYPYMYNSEMYMIDGYNYIFDTDGAMVTGWYETYDDCWFYADSKGHVYINKWLNSGGKWYYFDSYGEMATDLRYLDDGNYYYFNDNGVMQTGWVKPYSSSDSWFYFESSGKGANGVKTIDGKMYFFSDGYMYTGLAYGDDGKVYYAGNNGVLKTDCWIKLADSYSYSHYGYFGPKWIYLKSNGEAATGWEKIDGKYYYFDKTAGDPHCMVKGYVVAGSKFYYCDNSGVMQTGWFKVNGQYLWANSKGELATGWKNIGGKWYYFDEYYGFMKTGFQVIQDLDDYWYKLYFFDDNGVCKNHDNPVFYEYIS